MADDAATGALLILWTALAGSGMPESVEVAGQVLSPRGASTLLAGLDKPVTLGGARRGGDLALTYSHDSGDQAFGVRMVKRYAELSNAVIRLESSSSRVVLPRAEAIALGEDYMFSAGFTAAAFRVDAMGPVRIEIGGAADVFSEGPPPNLSGYDIAQMIADLEH